MAEETQEWIRAGFVRQRRNLMLVSVALLAFQQVGAELHELNLLGNKIDLEHPLRVVVPLWLLWLYFGVRYYVYVRDLGDKGFKSIMWKHHDRLAQRAAARQLSKKLRPNVDGFVRPQWKITVHQLIAMANPTGARQFEASGLVMVTEPGTLKQQGQPFSGEPVTLSASTLRFPRIRGLGWAMLHTHRGTEYVLPVAIAAMPLAIELPGLVGLVTGYFRY
jgi:hypothetical protein